MPPGPRTRASPSRAGESWKEGRTRGKELLTGTVDELLRDRLAADDGTRGRDWSFGGHVQIDVSERDEGKRVGRRSDGYNCFFPDRIS